MKPNCSQDFSLDRPSLDPAWLDQFYRLYEYKEGEEALEQGLKNIRPWVQDGKMPEAYSAYFSSLNCFWNSYKAVCAKNQIKPIVPAPILPQTVAEMESFTNDHLLAYKKGAIRSFVWLCMRPNRLFQHSTIADYLGADDEGRLNIAEREGDDSDFQLLLVEVVEIKIDFEEILDYLQHYWPKYELTHPKPDDPVNPWLAGVIAAFLKTHRGERLRERYELAVEGDPKTPWDVFLAREALEEAVRDNAFYAMKIEDTPLSYEVKARLNNHRAERIYDLLQITKEELRELEGISPENVKEINDYLAANGCHLEKGGYADTWKISRKEDDRDRELRYGAYRAALRKADELRKNCGDDPARIRETVHAFQSVYRLCDEKNIDVERRASILCLYCNFVMEKRGICPEITHNFNDYATAMVTYFEYTYGYMHLLAADAHRDVGKWLLELGQATTALLRFNLAASIYEERGASEEVEKCRQLAAEAAAKQ